METGKIPQEDSMAQTHLENESIHKSLLNQKGSLLLILGAVVVILVVLGTGAYVLLGTRNNFLKSSSNPTISPNNSLDKETVVNDVIMKHDTIKKDTVNNVNSLMKQYYVQNGTYPKSLIDLRTMFNIDDGDLKLYNSPPFYFTSNGTSYEYYAKLNTGENFKGDTEGTNKNLDASIQVDVDQIVQAVNLFYFGMKRLPKTLEEISTLPDLSYFKVNNNPITGKPYTYVPKSDGAGFTVSGTLSNGNEYKQDIPIN